MVWGKACAAGALGLVLSFPAFAEIDEIKVTARKREESALTVPLAITAVPPSQLEKQGADTIEDLESLSPNIVIDPISAGPSGAAIAIRGVSFEDIEKSFDPAVGVVIDGVYIGTNTGQLVDFFDFEAIEVLRGPQGTLFGKNTTGGVINIRRSRPTGEFGIKASATFGNFDRRDYKAVLNFPIWREKLAGKVFFFDQNFGGFMENVTRNETRGKFESRNFGATLRFTPTGWFTMQTTVEYMEDEAQPEVGALHRTPPLTDFLELNNLPVIINALASGNLLEAIGGVVANGFQPDLICLGSVLTAVSPVPQTQIFAPPNECDRNNRDDLYTTFGELDAFSEYEAIGSSNEITIDLGAFSITAVTGYRSSEERVVQDFDASSVEFFWTDRPQDYRQISQELRFQGPVLEWLYLTVGAYYWHSDYQNLYALNTPLSPTGPIVTDVDHSVDSYAGFLDINIDLTERLRFSAGGRYTYEKKHIISILPNSPFTVGGRADLEESWAEFTPRASVDYKLTDTQFVYASYARGFRSGGFNGRATTTSSVGPYNPEFVDSYELGFKALLFGSRLSMNTAAFYTDYSDKQEEIVRLVPAITANPQETVVENVAGARIWGIELDFTADIIEWLNIFGAIGYLNAEYSEFAKDLDGDGTIDDATSLEMRRTPDITYSIGANITQQLAGGEASFNTTFRFIDSYETTIVQDPDDPTRNDRRGTADPQYQLTANLAYAFEVQGVKLKASAFGRNLLNDKGLSAALPVAGLITFGVGRVPRTYGGELKVEW